MLFSRQFIYVFTTIRLLLLDISIQIKFTPKHQKHLGSKPFLTISIVAKSMSGLFQEFHAPSTKTWSAQIPVCHKVFKSHK